MYIYIMTACTEMPSYILSLFEAVPLKVRPQSVVKNDKMWKSLKRVSPEGGLEFWWDVEMCCYFIHVTVKSRERLKDL